MSSSYLFYASNSESEFPMDCLLRQLISEGLVNKKVKWVSNEAVLVHVISLQNTMGRLYMYLAVGENTNCYRADQDLETRS